MTPNTIERTEASSYVFLETAAKGQAVGRNGVSKIRKLRFVLDKQTNTADIVVDNSKGEQTKGGFHNLPPPAIIQLADALSQEIHPVKHARTVVGVEVPDLARRVASLHYETLEAFLEALASFLEADAKADNERGRPKLAQSLQNTAEAIKAARDHMQNAWKISRPFMVENPIKAHEEETSANSNQKA